MSDRLLSMSSSQIAKLKGKKLIDAIRLSEGSIMAAETVSTMAPLLNDVSNAELCSALSADIIILNMFDVNKPFVQGLPEHKEEDTIKLLKKLTGRVIGINLEPTDENENGEGWTMTKGRVANAENALKAYKLGADIIVVTGNPGNHVSNEAIFRSIREIRKAVKNNVVIISGKMHASGSIDEAGENIISEKDIENFVKAGTDIIMLPAPGTIPGLSVERIQQLISYAHSLGVLAMTVIGTSQEGADTDTIKTIALNCKMAGADIHHIGDSGYNGMAVPENIMAYSIAIRGVRHTYRRMAISINR
ncbi:MAG: haloacid dehalogenase-like hydrolase [Erysipelotrichaceae bacterium]|nr:haloacid dehalogenase-like hydrolase [Erysipelotrichaceae bacterium]